MRTPEPRDDNWPAWYYGPNGESGVFQSAAAVPEGWENHPSAFEGRPPAPVAGAQPLTRKQIVADLNARKVEYDATAPTARLYELLVEAIDATS